MKKLHILGVLLLIMASLVANVAAAAATDTTSSTSTDSVSTTTASYASTVTYLSVTNVTMNPTAFYPGEVGTISVTITNSGETAIGVSNPEIISNVVNTVNANALNVKSYIAAGTSMTFPMQVKAGVTEGTFFPMFTISTIDGGSVHYPLTVKIDSTEVTATVSDTPDAFGVAKEDNVTVNIINPRDSAIQNVIITAVGDSVSTSPTQKYVGTLAAESSADVTFEVTPSSQTTLTFHITYETGDTKHSTDVVLPINIGTDKESAVPTINNIELTSKGSYYELTGDITNTGITNAKGMVVSVGSPATGTSTYPVYALGSLASDDSGSFDLTFTATDLTNIPLITTWKDTDGTSYTVITTLNLQSMVQPTDATASTAGTGTTQQSSAINSGGSMGGPMGGSSSNPFAAKGSSSGFAAYYPIIAAGILIGAGAILYKKRKIVMPKIALVISKIKKE
jgi:hypothetical protein